MPTRKTPVKISRKSVNPFKSYGTQGEFGHSWFPKFIEFGQCFFFIRQMATLVILAVFTFVVSLLNNKGQWHIVLLHLCGIALFNVPNGDDRDSRSSYVEGEWQGNAMIDYGVLKIR